MSSFLTKVRIFAGRLLNIKDLGLAVHLLLLPLTLISFLYHAAVHLRRVLYAKGIIKSHCLSCKVVSIGNITVGGTGKTPIVYYIARHLKGAGINACILIRGYRAKRPAQSVVVTDGQQVLAGPEAAGDEAYMLARKLSGVPVLAGKDRAALGSSAVQTFAPQIVLLDDGFHYFRLRRDLDIVLINARNPFGNGYMLPRGILREPPSSLARAHMIILTKIDASTDVDSLEHTVKTYNPAALIFKASLKGKAVHKLSNKMISFDAIKGKRAIGVCSIGDHDSFFYLIESLGIVLLQKYAFPDHHWYGELDYTLINSSGREADMIITTEKDIAKMDNNMIANQKLVVLETEIQIADEEAFLENLYRLSGIPCS